MSHSLRKTCMSDSLRQTRMSEARLARHSWNLKAIHDISFMISHSSSSFIIISHQSSSFMISHSSSSVIISHHQSSSFMISPRLQVLQGSDAFAAVYFGCCLSLMLSVAVPKCAVLQCVAVRVAVLSFYRWLRAQIFMLSTTPKYAALQCVAVCCSVLQCVAVCRSVLQCVAVCCSVLQCGAVWNSVWLWFQRQWRACTMLLWCERCLLITESPKTPGHYRYLIWVVVYIPYTGLAVYHVVTVQFEFSIRCVAVCCSVLYGNVVCRNRSRGVGELGWC